MTRENAETVANLLIGAAVVAASYWILKDPERRRTVWKAARQVSIASGPWLLSQARQAWAETGPPATSAITYTEGHAPAL
ncbi:MAG: hypothetical protein ACRD15_20140 [Vicinamibacterales bacterium]